LKCNFERDHNHTGEFYMKYFVQVKSYEHGDGETLRLRATNLTWV